MTPRRILAIAVGAGLLVACGGKPPGGPTPPIDPPRISCPVDITVSGVTGTSQTVDFPVPTATAGTPPVTVACAPGAGSAFPLGTTAVRCTATDSTSRPGVCNFNVTLKGFTIGVTKYLAYGDSVTEGQNGLPGFTLDIVDVPNSYPTKLQQLLVASFPGQDMTVLNSGRGGEPVEEAAPRLSGVVAQAKPGAMLLIDGYNNLLRHCRESDGAAVTQLCVDEIDFVAGKMREMVRTARAGGASAVFVGTLTPPGPWEGNIANRRLIPAAVTRMNAKLKQQIPGEGATVVDIHAAFLGHEAEYTGPDGLHIDPPGNQAIANAFFAAIKAAIVQTPAFGPR